MPALGDLIPTGRGTEVTVHAPTHCRAGHQLRGNVHIGHARCDCVQRESRLHTIWTCRTCRDAQHGPPHTGPSPAPLQTAGVTPLADGYGLYPRR